MPWLYEGHGGALELDENPLMHCAVTGRRIGVHIPAVPSAIEISTGTRRAGEVFRTWRAGFDAGSAGGELTPLAWTGRTAMQPVSLTIRSLPYDLDRMPEQVATEFTLTLVEPSGVGLYTALHGLALKYGWPNLLAMPWLVTVELLGQLTPDHPAFGRLGPGATVLDIGRRLGSPRVFAWLVQPVQAETQVDPQGARHEIRCVPYGEIPQLGRYAVLPRAYAIEALTVGDALDRLQAEINEDWRRDWATHEGSPHVEIAFEVHPLDPALPGYDALIALVGEPDPREWTLINGASTDPARQNATDPDEPFGIVLHTARGDPLARVLTGIVQSTRQHNLLTTGGAAAEDLATTDEGKRNPWTVRYRVVPRAEILEPGGPHGLPHLRLVYHLVPYVVLDQPPSVQHERAAFDRSPAEVMEILGEANTTGRLRKWYPFQWTGLDTEVLEARLDWNFLAMYLYAGMTGASTADTQGNDSARVPMEHFELRFGGAIPEVTPVRAPAEDPPATTAPVATTPLPPPRPTVPAVAAEDPTVDEMAAGLTDREPAGAQAKTTLPRMFGTGVAHRAGRSLRPETVGEYGQRLETADTELVRDVRFLKLELVIRGDPYWLPDETSDPGILTEPVRDDPTETPPFWTGSLLFLFSTRVPRAASPGSGQTVALDADSAVSGVYMVTEIVHRFEEDGGFRQELHGVRVTSLMEIPKDLPTAVRFELVAP